MNIVVDIGNTIVKFGFFKDGQLINFSIPTNVQRTVDSLYYETKSFFDKFHINVFVISSVVPDFDSLLKQLITKFYQAKIIFVTKVKNEDLKMPNEYKSIIGSDILVNSFFASKVLQNAIVISMGTATVITKIKNKELLGTIIVPGLDLAKNNLINSAAKLNDVVLKKPQSQLGQNTEEALYLGIFKGHFFTLKGFINELREENTKVIITGGNTIKLKDFFIENHIEISYLDNLVLRGLDLYYKTYIEKNL